MIEPELRDKDRVVLHSIQDEKNDVQKITAATTLKNHHVSYSFQKLEENGLIQASKPDTMIERVIDGQKRVFQHPKQAELTEKGEQYLEESEQKDIDKFENLSHKELVEEVHQLEEKIEDMEKKFEVFRKQVKELI